MISVMDFGAIADGASHPLSERYATLAAAQADYPFATSLSQEIDWAAWQAGINAAINNGQTLYAPSGHYICGSALAVYLNSAGPGVRTPSITGDGSSCTIVTYTGADLGTTPFIYVHGDFSQRFTLSGLQIVRPDSTPVHSLGLAVDTMVAPVLRDLLLFRWQTGLYLVNCNSGTLENCAFSYNAYGANLEGRNTTTEANAYIFLKCGFNSNINAGVSIHNGCANTFKSCNFEGNGSPDGVSITPGGVALYASCAGDTGGQSLTVEGCYFEGNGGSADIYGQNTGGCAYFISGNTFNRISSTLYVVQNIYIDASSMPAGGPKTMVTLAGNGFKSYGSYQNDPSRRAVVLATGSSSYDGYVFNDDAPLSAYPPSSEPVVPMQIVDNSQTRPLAFGFFDGAGNLSQSYGVASVSHTGTGQYQINLVHAAPNGKPILAGATAGSYFRHSISGWTANSIAISFWNTAGGSQDCDNFEFVVYGL